MARGGKGPTRLELRRQSEAVEARGDAAPAETEAKPSRGKKAASPKAKKPAAKPRKSKEKVPQRKRLVWVVFSPTMKEEARFAYDQRTAAEEKVAALKARYNNKPYFIQPLKEVLGDAAAPTAKAVAVAKTAHVPDEDEDDEAAADEE